MGLTALNHVTVRTEHLDATKDWYEKVLGMRAGWRPDLGFPGYWMYCGEAAVIHVVPPGYELGGSDADETGNFDHVAFTAENFDAMRRHFLDLGISFRERHRADGLFRQLFVYDPNRVMFELNFREPGG